MIIIISYESFFHNILWNLSLILVRGCKHSNWKKKNFAIVNLNVKKKKCVTVNESYYLIKIIIMIIIMIMADVLNYQMGYFLKKKEKRVISAASSRVNLKKKIRVMSFLY